MLGEEEMESWTFRVDSRQVSLGGPLGFPGMTLPTLPYVENVCNDMSGCRVTGAEQEPMVHPATPPPQSAPPLRGLFQSICFPQSPNLICSQLINLKPIRIFPSTRTCSQESGRDRQEGLGREKQTETPPDRGWVLTWVRQLLRWAGLGLRRWWRDEGSPRDTSLSPLLIHTGTGESPLRAGEASGAVGGWDEGTEGLVTMTCSQPHHT